MSTKASRALSRISDELRSGRHPLLTGATGDLVLLLGEVERLPSAVAQLAGSAFDLVVRVTGDEVLEVLEGELEEPDTPSTAATSPGSPDHASSDNDAQPTRAERIAALSRGRDRDDVIATIRDLLVQDQRSVAVVVEQADILLQNPEDHTQVERHQIANLKLALQDAAWVGPYRNTCFLLAGNDHDIPAVLLSGSDDVALIEVQRPYRQERTQFLELRFADFHGAAELEPAQRSMMVERVAALTEGDSLRSIDALAAYSRGAKLPITSPRELVMRHRHGDRPDNWSGLTSRLPEIAKYLESQIVGQSAAIDAVAGVLSASALGLRMTGDAFSTEAMPRGVLWFQGPTGVGKTELAKSLAASLFGDPEALIRLDMALFAQEHAAERLVGSPPGYVGFEQGGELTNAVRERPNSVILLDEIEKAHPRVIDRFLSIFDDGRVTDAQGRVAYFNEAIIVATTNVGAPQLQDLITSRGDDLSYRDVRQSGERAVREWFTSIGRPELFGRIEPGVVVFDALRPAMIQGIVEKLVATAAFDTGPLLTIDVASTSAAVQRTLADPALRALGGRQVRNIMQTNLRSLATWLAMNGHYGAERIDLEFDNDGSMLVAVDGRMYSIA